MKTAPAVLCLIAVVAGVAGIGAETPDMSLTPVFALGSYSGVRSFLTPQALCMDGESNVYVADTGNGRIAVFNHEGHLATSFRHTLGGDRRGEPLGVAVDKSGRIYVTDSSSHAIHIYDSRGRLTGSIKPGPEDAGVLFGRMALDGSDNLYVVARNKGQIFVYDENHALTRKLGGAKGDKKLEMASDVAVDAQGRIYALSSLGTAVHVYSQAGVPLFSFGEHSGGRDGVSFPTALDVDPQGRIWVTDSFAHRIRIYSSAGSYLTDIGGWSFPVDTALLSKRMQVFVLEKNAQRLSAYRVEW